MEENNEEKQSNFKTVKNPSNVKSGSHDVVWWKCDKGHEYQSKVYEKTKGYGCPYCSGRKVLTGYNDLKVKSPTLIRITNKKVSEYYEGFEDIKNVLKK